MVYIHSDSERKLPSNFDAACALYGAIENAEDIRLTTLDEIISGKFDMLIRKHVFAGSTEFMQAVFGRVYNKLPSVHFLMPDYIQTVLQDVRNRVSNGEIWFVKPLQTKLFTGMVFDAGTIFQLASYSEETKVLIAKPFDSKIVSETRCYVHKNKVIDARNYAGNFRVTPNWYWVDSLVSSLYPAPSAFTIDVGVLADGRSVVIEYNDLWAIGNYGIENAVYYELLAERYFEIMAGLLLEKARNKADIISEEKGYTNEQLAKMLDRK